MKIEEIAEQYLDNMTAMVDDLHRNVKVVGKDDAKSRIKEAFIAGYKAGWNEGFEESSEYIKNLKAELDAIGADHAAMQKMIP